MYAYIFLAFANSNIYVSVVAVPLPLGILAKIFLSSLKEQIIHSRSRADHTTLLRSPTL
jgi:hypothetical protein